MATGPQGETVKRTKLAVLAMAAATATGLIQARSDAAVRPQAHKATRTQVFQDPDHDASGPSKALRKNAEIRHYRITSTPAKVTVKIALDDLTKPVRKEYNISGWMKGTFFEWGYSVAVDPMKAPELFFVISEESAPKTCRNKMTAHPDFAGDSLTISAPKSCFPAGQKISRLKVLATSYSANYNRQGYDETREEKFKIRP